MPNSVEKYSQRIRDELASLESQPDVASDETKPVELDQQSVGRLSRIDAIQRQAMAAETRRRRDRRRIQLRQALKRIDRDEFGYCTECGETIPDDRLNVDPAFHQCVKCAS